MAGCEIDNPQSAIRNRPADLSGQLLAVLQGADRPIPAIELAERLAIEGNHESKRRSIRKLVEKLHAGGYAVCADCHGTEGGYWLARSDKEWHEYKETRQGGARFEFVRARQMAVAARERSDGQQVMFG